MPKHNYERFFSQSRDLLCVANLDGYFLEVNSAFTKTLGYSKEILLSSPFTDFIHPNDLDSTATEIARLGQGLETVNFENRYLHQNGEYVTLSWSSVVDHETGNIIASARDVTEYTNQARKLKQIEATLEEKVIIVETDKKGVITYANENFCDISGFSKKELIGNTHSIVNSGIHDKQFFQDMWRTISKKKVWSGDITNRRKNGELYFVKTTITPLTDNEGEIQSYLAIRQDISDKIQHKTDLAKTLEILSETSSIAKVGGWELDVATGKLTWTDETFRILEVEKKDGLSPMLPEGISLFIPEHSGIVEKAIQHCLATGEPYSLELIALTPKGKQLWVYTNGKANYENGEIKTLSGTIQDIDDKKTAEMEYNLERQKSIQSAKLASLGELAASMAHEINNPLGIISGYSELLMRSNSDNSDALSKIEVILKSCNRISHIVNNLKKFSRSGDSREQSKIVLSDVVKEAIMLAKPRLKRGIVALEFDSGSEASILGNIIEIEQVFLNLINNAVDAVKDLPERWVKLKLSEQSNSVVFRITDSGSGIKKSELNKIFSPFYTSKKMGEGTGLGLSIVDGILKDHAATIKYDEGSSNTSFILTFNKLEE